MTIGINASAAFKPNPSGVEEYVFELIKHLAMLPQIKQHRIILYINPHLTYRRKLLSKLPNNFLVKDLFFPIIWTQVRLAWQLAKEKLDVLFIPVHILPLIHPKNSVVTIHGLEYEYYPQMYPLFHRKYLVWSTKYALKNAKKIIAVSENTKRDLIKLYGADPGKITVVYHGISVSPQIHKSPYFPLYKTCGERSTLLTPGLVETTLGELRRTREISGRGVLQRRIRLWRRSATGGKGDFSSQQYVLYLGRLELKKNIIGLIKAFNEFKTKNLKLQTKLVLAGSRGFGWQKIQETIEKSQFKDDIILKNYVSPKEKQDLLKNAAAFILVSFYEGFGMPILEAQTAGVPVICSNISSLPEVAGEGTVLVNPKNISEISEAINKVLNDKTLRNDLITEGFENVKKFSWQKCASETLEILTSYE